MYKLLASANWDENKAKANYWVGILKHNNVFIMNCIHGSISGFLMLEWNKKEHFFEPCELRDIVKRLTGIIIPKNKKIRISPCYPVAVKKRYAEELRDGNIEVVGVWNTQTTNGIWWHTNNKETCKLVVKNYPDQTVEFGF